MLLRSHLSLQHPSTTALGPQPQTFAQLPIPLKDQLLSIFREHVKLLPRNNYIGKFEDAKNRTIFMWKHAGGRGSSKYDSSDPGHACGPCVKNSRPSILRKYGVNFLLPVPEDVLLSQRPGPLGPIDLGF